MTKGRLHAPSKAREGHWAGKTQTGGKILLLVMRELDRTCVLRAFRHNRGASEHIEETITRDMLQEPFSELGRTYPPAPPPPYKSRAQGYFDFSQHDNRHAQKDHGVYFGNGKDTRLLGRRLIPLDERLHRTHKSFLTHHCLVPVEYDYLTNYKQHHLGLPTPTPPTHRRFPRVYPPESQGLRPPSTTTTSEFKPPDIPYKIPQSVLHATFQARNKPNSWKYSYNAPPSIYPPYNIETTTLATVLNKHGAAFNIPRPIAK